MADENTNNANPPNTPPPPDLSKIPEKFRRATLEESVQAMSEGYVNLEKTLHTKAEPISMQPKAIPDDATPEQIINHAGLNPGDLVKQFVEKGSLTEDQYKALKEKAGLPKGAVNALAEGILAKSKVQEANAQRAQLEAAAEFGGMAEVQKMAEKVGETLSADMRSTFQAKLNSGDPATVKDAIRAIAAMHKASNGAATPNVNGGVATTPPGNINIDGLIKRVENNDYKAINELAAVPDEVFNSSRKAFF